MRDILVWYRRTFTALSACYFKAEYKLQETQVKHLDKQNLHMPPTEKNS